MSKIQQFYEDEFGTEIPVNKDVVLMMKENNFTDTTMASYEDVIGGTHDFEQFAVKYHIPGNDLIHKVERRYLQAYELYYRSLHHIQSGSQSKSQDSTPIQSTISSKPSEQIQTKITAQKQMIKSQPTNDNDVDDILDAINDSDVVPPKSAPESSQTSSQTISQDEQVSKPMSQEEVFDAVDDYFGNSTGANNEEKSAIGDSSKKSSNALTESQTTSKEKIQSTFDTTASSKSDKDEDDKIDNVISNGTVEDFDDNLVEDSANNLRLNLNDLLYDLPDNLEQPIIDNTVTVTAKLNHDSHLMRPEIEHGYLDLLRAYWVAILPGKNIRRLIQRCGAGVLLQGFIIYNLALNGFVYKHDYQKWCIAQIIDGINNSNRKPYEEATSLANLAMDSRVKYPSRFYALLLMLKPWKARQEQSQNYVIENLSRNVLLNQALLGSILNLQSPESDKWNDDLIGDNVKRLRDVINNLSMDLTAPYKTMDRTKNSRRKQHNQ